MTEQEPDARQHWIDIAGGWKPPAQADPGFPGFAATKLPGVGFSVARGTPSCWEGGNVPKGCAPIDLSAEPFGPDGNLELSQIDPVLLARRYKGGDMNNQGWPQGFANELFNNNYLALRLMWERGMFGAEGDKRTGIPTWQEMYDLAFTTSRTSRLYRTWLVDRNPEVSTDPAKPIPVRMKTPWKYNWSEHTTFKGVTLYNENTAWLPGNGPMYQPGYPEVFGKDPNAPPSTPPLPPPGPPSPVVPPPAPAPVPPPSGALSSPEIRVEELRVMIRDLMGAEPLSFPNGLVRVLSQDARWRFARPFAVECLNLYRLARRKLGDEREIPR